MIIYIEKGHIYLDRNLIWEYPTLRVSQETGKPLINVSEAGFIGGTQTLQRYGKEHLSKAGKKGGEIGRSRWSNKNIGTKAETHPTLPVTVREAGRRGGERLKERYGIERFKELGRASSALQKSTLGEAEYKKQMRARGQKGGKSSAKKLGHQGYSDLGKIGGNKLKQEKAETDPDYYSRMGRTSAAARKKAKEGLAPKA